MCVNISFAGRTDLLVPTPINFRLSCSSGIQRKMVMKNVNRRQLSTSESDNSSVCRLFHTQARTHTEVFLSVVRAGLRNGTGREVPTSGALGGRNDDGFGDDVRPTINHIGQRAA